MALIRVLVFKQRPLRYVDFAIGYACNLKCEHCFATALQSSGRRSLTPQEYRGIVHQAMDLGAVNFSFQGGEPTLYPQLREYIRNAFPHQNLVSVTTNGTMLDEEKILDLRSIGVDILTISLDSANPEEHDRFRGVRGTFEKTMKTITTARKLRMNVTLGAVIAKGTVFTPGFRELVELAHRLNVILFVAMATPVGAWEGREDVMLTSEDKAHLEVLLRKYPLLRTDFEANWVARGCGAVKEILYLTPYGDVLGCPFLHVSLGNVFEETLKEIRTRRLSSKWFSQYHPHCLAAEDKEFIRQFQGQFYCGEGMPRRFVDQGLSS